MAISPPGLQQRHQQQASSPADRGPGSLFCPAGPSVQDLAAVRTCRGLRLRRLGQAAPTRVKETKAPCIARDPIVTCAVSKSPSLWPRQRGTKQESAG